MASNVKGAEIVETRHRMCSDNGGTGVHAGGVHLVGSASSECSKWGPCKAVVIASVMVLVGIDRRRFRCVKLGFVLIPSTMDWRPSYSMA